MLIALVLGVLGIPLAAIALMDGRRLILCLLVVAGIPVSMLVPGSDSLGALGRFSPQAAYLMVIALGLVFATIRGVDTLVWVVRLFPLLTLFLTYAAISIAWSPDVTEGLRLLVKLAILPLMVAAVAHNLRGGNDVLRAENSLLICAGAVAGLAVVNQFSGGVLSAGTNDWIAGGILTAPYMSPANFSFLMGVAALTCFAHFLHSGARLALALAAMFGTAVFLAFTRISMAALSVSGCLLLVLQSRRRVARYILPAALLGVVVGSVFLSDTIRSRMFTHPDEPDLSLALDDPGDFLTLVNTSGRLSIWEAALEHYQAASHLTGAGLGATDHWLNKYSTANALHSEYLRVYIDTGAIGLLLFTAGLVQVLVFAIRSGRHAGGQDPAERRNGALTLSLMVFFMITLFTDNSLNYASEFGLYVFASVGGLVACNEQSGTVESV